MLTFDNLINIFDFCDEKTKINVFISVLNSSNIFLKNKLIEYFDFKKNKFSKKIYDITISTPLKLTKNKKINHLKKLKIYKKSLKKYIYYFGIVEEKKNNYFIKKSEGFLDLCLNKHNIYTQIWKIKTDFLEGDIISKSDYYLKKAQEFDKFIEYKCDQIKNNEVGKDILHDLSRYKNLEKISVELASYNIQLDPEIHIYKYAKLKKYNFTLNYYIPGMKLTIKQVCEQETSLEINNDDMQTIPIVLEQKLLISQEDNESFPKRVKLSDNKISVKIFYYNFENYQILDIFDIETLYIKYVTYISYKYGLEDGDILKQKNIKNITLSVEFYHIAPSYKENIQNILNCFEDLEVITFRHEYCDNKKKLTEFINFISNLNYKEIYFKYNKIINRIK